MPSLVHPQGPEQMESLATGSLMTLRNKMLRCEEAPQFSDLQPGDVVDPAVIRFKSDPRWAVMYDSLKAILDQREHVPGGPEREQMRKQAPKRRPGRRLKR